MLGRQHQAKFKLYGFSLMTCELLWNCDGLLIGYQHTANMRSDFNQADIS